MQPIKNRAQDGLQILALACATAGLLLWPAEGAQAIKQGLVLCGNVLIPSLFPFFVLSSMVVELGFSRYLGRIFQGIMVPVFRVNGTCASALALGFVGGYPVGARTAINLYQNGQCTKTEANRLLAFCNNSGPAFIFGVVGANVFQSGRIGALLYFAHILGCLFVGFLFRFYKPSEAPPKKAPPLPHLQATSFSNAFVSSVLSGLTSTLNICAFVLCFTVIIRLLTLSGLLAYLGDFLSLILSPLGFSPAFAQAFLVGVIELASGVSTLSGDTALTTQLSMAAFMLGWAGISVHCQVLAFVGDSGLSLTTYFVGKLLHGIISAWIMACLAPFVPVSSYLTGQVEVMAHQEFRTAFWLSTSTALAVWICFAILAVCAAQKKSGNKSNKGV